MREVEIGMDYYDLDADAVRPGPQPRRADRPRAIRLLGGCSHAYMPHRRRPARQTKRVPRDRRSSLAAAHLSVISTAGGRIDYLAAKSKSCRPPDQLYAEYFIPKKRTSPFPVVMVHGGSQTGTNFTGTPDGREGWAQYFLRRGHAVYVVDQVARGRAAHFSQSQGKVQAGNLQRTEQRFVAPKRFNLWPQAKRHTQWPGSGKPGDTVFDAFYATQFPSLESYPEAAGDQPRRAHRAAGADRTGGAAGAFAIGRLRLAGRRRAAEAREGDRRDRAERPAGLRDRLQGRAGLVRRRGHEKKHPASAWCRSPTIRR